MDIVIASDRTRMGAYAAAQAGQILRNAIAEKGRAALIVATGSSQFEVLDHLSREQDIDWARVDGFHLDEYIGIDRTHPASFCGYLAKRFVDRVPIRSFHFLDGTKDPVQVCEEASKAIKGQTIDVAMVGIGENSHLAFNDPPADFDTLQPYLMVQLDEACRRQQVGEGWFDALADVPEQAITMSIHRILLSDTIICSVPDRRKAAAVRATVEGAITPDFPASILQRHPSTILVLDTPAASELSESTIAAATRLED